MPVNIQGGNYNAGTSLNITSIVINNAANSSNKALPYHNTPQNNAVGDKEQDLIISIAVLQSSVESVTSWLAALSVHSVSYVALDKTLDKIYRITIPTMISMAIQGIMKTHPRLEGKIRRKISCMRVVLDNFMAAREVTFQKLIEQQIDGLRDILNVLFVTWTLICWTFCEERLVKGLNKCLEELRCATNSLLFEVSVSNSYQCICFARIDFFDFFGDRWSLPEDLCSDKEIFEAVLRLKFREGPAELVIATQRFRVFAEGQRKAITPDAWEETIRARHTFRLCVIVIQSQVQKARVRCPRCAAHNIHVESELEWIECNRCNSNFNIRTTEFETFNYITDVQKCNHQRPATFDQDAPFKNYSIHVETSHATTSLAVNGNDHDSPRSASPIHDSTRSFSDRIHSSEVGSLPFNTDNNNPQLTMDDPSSTTGHATTARGTASSSTARPIDVRTVDIDPIKSLASVVSQDLSSSSDPTPRPQDLLKLPNVDEIYDVTNYVKGTRDRLSDLLLNETEWRNGLSFEYYEVLEKSVDKFCYFCEAMVALFKTFSTLAERVTTLFSSILEPKHSSASATRTTQVIRGLLSEIASISVNIALVEEQYTGFLLQSADLLQIAPGDPRSQCYWIDDMLFQRLDAFWKVVATQLSSVLERRTKLPHRDLSHFAKESWSEYGRCLFGAIALLKQASHALKAGTDGLRIYHHQSGLLPAC